ncbi:hypothetical protein [Streptomyces violaceusniger]|uniref:Uncharacterized protein n=1 Tax=Streptomyces violaceusniger (strain Tu 4113) TaxID=653045 RepID=G2PGY4_STRV4|nr:hypothetical protein [Streptomyces violaceusniger]AEM88698.1 hypothetical protein Strvi_9444 [Streptomyces violaceusniger Tu 4113]
MKHPVAVVGQVAAAGTSRGGQPWRRIAANLPTGLPGRLAVADVYLRSDHPELLEPLTEGTSVLALAAPDVPWKLFVPKSGGHHQLVLWPRTHWQLAYWIADPATGRSTVPRTPPSVKSPPRTRPARPKPVPRPTVRPPERGTSALQGEAAEPAGPMAPPAAPVPPPADPPQPTGSPSEPTLEALSPAAPPGETTSGPSPLPPVPPVPPVPPLPPTMPSVPLPTAPRRPRKGLFKRWRNR